MNHGLLLHSVLLIDRLRFKRRTLLLNRFWLPGGLHHWLRCLPRHCRLRHRRLFIASFGNWRYRIWHLRFNRGRLLPGFIRLNRRLRVLNGLWVTFRRWRDNRFTGLRSRCGLPCHCRSGLL